MAVRAYSPVLPSIELFGAYEGIASATGVNQTVSLTFTPTSEGNLVAVPYDGDENISQMQLEAGSTPSSYIPTSGAAVTRAAETLTVPSANMPWPEPVYIGDELVANGTFDTDTSGWSIFGDAATALTWVLGEAEVSAPTAFDGITQTVSGLTVGKVYRLSVDILSVSGSGVFVQARTPGLTDTVQGAATSAGSVEVVFTAAATGRIISIISQAATAEFTIDNISVREIDPLAVSIQMDGRMTYADESASEQLVFTRWQESGVSYIRNGLTTAGSATGRVDFRQFSGVEDSVLSGGTAYSAGTLVPFNIASRHGSTFINGAVDGTALTANTTPTALPDLSATDLNLAFDYMGTIDLFRVWADDIGDDGIADAPAPSLEPSLSLTFDGTETSFTVFDWSE